MPTTAPMMPMIRENRLTFSKTYSTPIITRPMSTPKARPLRSLETVNQVNAGVPTRATALKIQTIMIAPYAFCFPILTGVNFTRAA